MRFGMKDRADLVLTGAQGLFGRFARSDVAEKADELRRRGSRAPDDADFGGKDGAVRPHGCQFQQAAKDGAFARLDTTSETLAMLGTQVRRDDDLREFPAKHIGATAVEDAF